MGLVLDLCRYTAITGSLFPHTHRRTLAPAPQTYYLSFSSYRYAHTCSVSCVRSHNRTNIIRQATLEDRKGTVCATLSERPIILTGLCAFTNTNVAVE